MTSRKLIITSKYCRKLFQTNQVFSRKMSTDTNDVVFENVNNNGLVTLNRPKQLNALNLSMVEKLYPVLRQWEKEKSLVLVKGSGEKAFCAGGDVRAVCKAGLEGSKQGHEFFKKEYTMNGLIGTYNIPYIALIDGIVMGGGVGMSVHGHYRVATEKTLFAMPEMIIGLFPDVGGSHFLPRLGGKLGCYLALTGERLKGPDVLKAGIATHYCNSSKLNELEKEILNCATPQELSAVLNKFNEKDEKEFSLGPYLSKINHCFSGNSVEEIFSRLELDGSEWALKTLDTLKKMSPTSLKIAHKALELGAQMSLQECLQMEYRIASACLANKDFYEGVRALLIDKDQNPQWNPKTLPEVTEDIVNRYFSKLPEAEELKHKL